MTVENFKPSLEPKRDPRNLARVLSVILIAGILGLITFGFLAWQTKAWQLVILAIAAAIPIPAAGLGFYWLKLGKNVATVPLSGSGTITRPSSHNFRYFRFQPDSDRSTG